MTSSTVLHVAVERLDDQRIYTLRDRLLLLAQRVGATELHLDLGPVESLGSTALSTIIGLHRRLAKAGTHLVLCQVRSEIVDLFRLTRLDTLLNIRGTGPDCGPAVSALA